MYKTAETIPELLHLFPAGLTPSKFLYPPVTALFFVPFSLLPYNLSASVWIILSVGALWGSIVIVLKSLDFEVSPLQYILISLFVVSYSPTVHSVKWGQISILLAAVGGFTLAGVIREQKRDVQLHSLVTGLGPVLLSIFKLIYAPAGTVLVYSKRRFMLAVLFGGVLVGGSLLVFGVGEHMHYISTLETLIGRNYGPAPFNQWDYEGAFYPLYPLRSYLSIIRFCLIFFVAGLAIAGVRTESDSIAVYATILAFVLIPLLNSRRNTHELNIFLPAMISWMGLEWQKENRLIIAPLAALLLVQVHPYSTYIVSRLASTSIVDIGVPVVILPWLQTGLWGIWLAFLVLVWKILNIVSASHSEPS